MKLNILCDADWESKVSDVIKYLNKLQYKQFFEKKNYGSSIEKILIDLMCQDPKLNLKQRIRFIKKEKILSLDIMLDLDEFKLLSQIERNAVVSNKIIKEVPLIIEKYKFDDFNLQKFETDLKGLLNIKKSFDYGLA